MKHIHLDPLGGIAGDMFVAAMLDAFPEWHERVFADIARVLPPEAGIVRLETVLKNGIRAKHFSLSETAVRTPNHAHDHYHEGGHHHNHHEHEDHHAHSHEIHGLPNNYASIKEHIKSAKLSAETEKHAIGIFSVLAKAEAYIHGVSEEDVHFHELAAWDTLMDIVAAASLVGVLESATWSLSPLPLGSGVVKTQHGFLPVPAPATARILEGYPWRSDPVSGERVTPTGAAIIRYLIPPESLSGKPDGVSCAYGYGAGTKNFSALPNILRVNVYQNKSRERCCTDKGASKQVVFLQFDIDDMSGEEIAVATEHLRAVEGVLDLILVPAQGKKGRPVSLFQLQILPEYLDKVSHAVFAETSTIGLRWSMMERHVLSRTPYQNEHGQMLKTVDRPGGGRSIKLEMDVIQSISGLEARRKAKIIAEGES